jgi:hypothetical protein
VPLFFGESFRLTNRTVQTKDSIRTDLKVWDIPRSTVAKLCGIHRSDFSAWLNNRQELSSTKVQRVFEMVEAIKRALSLYNVKFDVRDPANVKKLLWAVEQAEITVSAEDLDQLKSKTARLLAGLSGSVHLVNSSSATPSAGSLLNEQ